MGIEMRLKELRLNKEVSQAVIAEYLGVTKQAYSLYELGKREPDFETLLKLGEYFDVSIDYLLKGNENVIATDDDIKFALFDGEKGISDAAYEEVKNFAKYIKEKYKNDKST